MVVANTRWLPFATGSCTFVRCRQTWITTQLSRCTCGKVQMAEWWFWIFLHRCCGPTRTAASAGTCNAAAAASLGARHSATQRRMSLHDAMCGRKKVIIVHIEIGRTAWCIQFVRLPPWCRRWLIRLVRIYKNRFFLFKLFMHILKYLYGFIAVSKMKNITF